jgi:excisionase family DNA binding protein
MEPIKLLTAAEAAAYLNVTKPRVHALVRKRILPVIWLGGRQRFHPDELDRFLRGGGQRGDGARGGIHA